MKPASTALAAATAFAVTAALAFAALAQAPPGSLQEAASPPPPPRLYPAPTNLKVLPKNLTGQQVRDIMEGWEAALGTHCDHCHKADPKNLAPNGRPRLDFADDTKPEKSTARLMYKMVEDINVNYVGTIESSGVPVSCGTCHRGRPAPEPFVAPKEERHGPPPPPPGQQAPPLPH